VTVIIRLLGVAGDKAAALRRALREDADGVVFEVDPTTFGKVRGSPFAYWVSDHVRAIFHRHQPLQAQGRNALVGIQSSDDFRFLRLWTEVPAREASSKSSSAPRWFPFAKGGVFSKYYSDLPLVLAYSRGDQVALQAIGRFGRGATHYLRPGLTWPPRTQSGLGLRALPAGCIFGHKGPAAFVENDDAGDLLALLAVTTSAAFRYLVALQMAFGSYEVGVIQRTPVPTLSGDDRSALSSLALRAWSLKRNLDTTNETSHAFVLPRASNERMTGLDLTAIERELVGIQRDIDDRALDLYGIGATDRATIESFSTTGAPETAFSVESADENASDDEDAIAPIGTSTETQFSWLVGVAFGRFDLRLATGERAVPPEPEPFDPLPARSPGMWPEGEARSVLPPDILVDDPGHDRDLRSRVARSMERTGWPESQSLRPWLAHDFFPLHIKMYSKSRRKAPIYWQLATPSASYSVWLYLHALTPDTLYTVQREYVAPKVAHEERKLEAMRAEYGASAKANDRKLLAAQEAFVDELRALLAEVKRVTPLWTPHLDDGVVINAASLWRLFPQHRPWQKELLAAWEALCTGDHDWSHMAMRLWPERVVPKCAEDRSLAIAHGLEDAFWAEDSSGKWKKRERPATPVADLVKTFTSAAVKEALKNLLGAANPGTAGARRAPRRATRDA
jgi:hypothetical protein